MKHYQIGDWVHVREAGDPPFQYRGHIEEIEHSKNTEGEHVVVLKVRTRQGKQWHVLVPLDEVRVIKAAEPPNPKPLVIKIELDLSNIAHQVEDIKNLIRYNCGCRHAKHIS